MKADALFRQLIDEFIAEGNRKGAAQLLLDHRRALNDERRRERILKETGGIPVGVELQAKGERYAVICEEPDGTGRGRMVTFQPDGFYGHYVCATPAAALEEAMRSGYCTRVDGTLDRLVQTPRWAAGVRYAELVAQYNAGTISMQELKAQAQEGCSVV